MMQGQIRQDDNEDRRKLKKLVDLHNEFRQLLDVGASEDEEEDDAEDGANAANNLVQRQGSIEENQGEESKQPNQ